jgi:hypothetical protein
LELDELTHEQKVVLTAYLFTFSSHDGKTVLDDLKKSYLNKPFDESRLNDRGYLVQRATEQNVVLKIIRIMERAADVIQTTHGVKPARTPKVIVEAEEATA